MTGTTTTGVEIYRMIKDAVLTFSGSTHRSHVKEFRLWNNQIETLMEGQRTTLKFPFVGISYENNFDELSVGRDKVNGVFVLRLCLQSLNHDDEEVIQFKDELVAHVHRILRPLSAHRQYEVYDESHASILMHQLEFAYSYIDADSRDEKYYKTANPWQADYGVRYVDRVS